MKEKNILPDNINCTSTPAIYCSFARGTKEHEIINYMIRLSKQENMPCFAVVKYDHIDEQHIFINQDSEFSDVYDRYMRKYNQLNDATKPRFYGD